MIYNTNEDLDNIREEYDTNRAPDDVRYNTSVGDFLKEQKSFNPIRVPGEDTTDDETELWKNPMSQKPVGEREY